jgi:SH3-like domain-containing protein
MEKTGDWWRIEYGKGLYGYCSASYLTPVSSNAVTVSTNSGSLNVRTGPGTQYAKAASLYKGEVVLRLSTEGSWSRILYHGGKTGYVSSQYLSGSNSPVSFWVPYFKQTDPRWASVTLGSSGKPMSQIGCATTAIAMMESFRTVSTITPDVMSTNLRYTSSGNVYWPGHYTTVTNSSGYLNRIYLLLKQGKPVLLGATNSYGSQHWVVIRGFSGGSLSASNFSIHDPGTYGRTNLQQFLDVYPNFYKYFHY